MTTTCELLVVNFPLLLGKLAETKHTFGSVYGKYIGHSILVRLPQPGEPNQGSQTLAQMWEVAGWGCLPSWHVALHYVCIFTCVFSPGRLYPAALCSQEQFFCWQMCLQAPRRSAGNFPSCFPLAFHGGRASVS